MSSESPSESPLGSRGRAGGEREAEGGGEREEERGGADERPRAFTPRDDGMRNESRNAGMEQSLPSPLHPNDSMLGQVRMLRE